MRRITINLLVSILTFAIGIAGAALLGAFTTSKVSPNSRVVETTMTTSCPQKNQSLETAPISGGILNGKAISLPKPEYPAIARSARQSGTVSVQVIVDEDGRVISAKAVSGPPLLQAAAAKAAAEALFSPTKLSGKPVKVTGIITYNFELQ